MKRTLSRRLWGVAAGAAVAIAMMAPSTAAPPQDDSTDGPDVTTCTLGAGEWRRCLEVRGHLNHAPKKGQSALLTVELASSADLDDVSVRLQLPDALEWKKRPKGFGGKGGVATLTRDAEQGETVTFRGLVQAEEVAPASIRLEATTEHGAPYDSTADLVPLTIGATPQESYLGYGEGPHPTRPAATGGDRVTTDAQHVPASTAALPEPHTDDDPRPGIQAETCVEGSFSYTIGNDTFPSRNFQVEVWDSDPLSDDLLASGVTDQFGAFRHCFENDDGIGGGGQDVYIRFVATNESWRVGGDDTDEWAFRTETRDDLDDGATEDFGAQQPTNPDLHNVLRIFETVDTAHNRTPGECWDANDSDCRQIGVLWPMDEGGFYRRGDDEVHLEHAHAEDDFVISHEIGHGVMDDVYEDDYPDTGDDCAVHYIRLAESPACAWSEGFANWFALHANGTSATPNHGDFDSPTWGTADWDTGPNVEGRVAGALWDLHDSGWEAYWDGYTEGLSPVWDTFLNNRSTSFRQFWRQRGQQGHAAGDRQRSVLYQNTIDFDFHNELVDGSAGTFRSPEPPGEHNYKIETEHRFWSAVGVRPPGSADYDLQLFLDRLELLPLGRSAAGAGVTDFVAVDSNSGHDAPRRYYPQVEHVSGVGEYDIEFADAGALMPLGSVQRDMASDDVVEVLDVCTSGERTITVTPSNSGQDPELFVMASQPDGSGGVQTRASALRRSTGGAPGEEESISFDPPRPDCYGLVLVNAAGGGTYTLTMS